MNTQNFHHKKQLLQQVVVANLLLLGLSACGLNQAELDQTATQMAAYDFATQTAQAPTATATHTPSPTPTQTPTPIPTQTSTATVTPTATPRLLGMALTLDDLPPGFQEWSDREVRDLVSDLPDGAVGYGFEYDRGFQTVFGYLSPLMDYSDLMIFDNALPVMPNVLAAAFGADGEPELIYGLDTVGEIQIGFTFLSDMFNTPFRIEVIIFRQGRVEGYLFFFYPDDDEPTVQIVELAHLLDERIKMHVASQLN